MRRSPTLRLTNDERTILVEASAEAFMEKPTDGVWGAIQKGFEKLPSNRRPTLKKAKTWTWLLRSVQDRVAQLRKEENPEPVTIDLGTVSTELLLQEVASRLVSDVVNQLKEAIETKTKEDVRHKVEEVQRRQRIVIVGLLRRQENVIKTEFGKEFDLRFIKPVGSHAGQTLIDKCKHADHVLAMTSFISHNAEYAIRTLNGSYTRVSGGLADLKSKLTELYLR